MHDHRQDRDHAAGRQHSPGQLELADHELKADGPGPRTLAGRQHEGEEIFVPRRDRDEDAGGDEPVAGDRDDDAQHGADTGRTVDPRGALELLGRCIEEAFQHPHEERQQEARVGDREAPGTVEHADTAHHDEQRNDHQYGREHANHEVAQHQLRAARKTEPGECVRRDRAGEEADQHREAGDHQAVDHQHRIARLRPQLHIPFEGKARRDVDHLARHDVRFHLDRG